MRSSLRVIVLAVLACAVLAPSASAQVVPICSSECIPSPLVTTGPAIKVGNTDAWLTGDVDTQGFDRTCHFEWDTSSGAFSEGTYAFRTDDVLVSDAPGDQPVPQGHITGLDRN